MDYAKQIRRRLQNLGVSYPHAKKTADWFQNQIRSRGPEGALGVLKAYGDTILWYLFGTPEKPAWVKTKHRFPQKIFFLKEHSEEVLLRVAKFARSIVLVTLSKKQSEKVLKGATDPYLGSESGITLVSKYIKLGVQDAGFEPSPFQPSRPPTLSRLFKKVMSVSGPTGMVSEPPIRESLEILQGCPFLANLPYWKEAFWPLNPDSVRVDANWSGFVGEIHAAQEGGGKLRMFASPYTVFQTLLSPIHDWLDLFRRVLPTDCTYNQLAGAQWSQFHLKQGITIHSVDLSTATCRFPWESQEMLLSLLGLGEEFIDALRSVSKGRWKVDESLREFFPDVISWEVGQPLGIKPSMSLFSLAHNLLLRGMCVELGVSTSSFRVLGDDVVLRGDKLHNLYREVMAEAGVPISHSKCHSSNQFAEFAGASITRSTIMRPGRWKAAGQTNHLSIAEDLGRPLNREVSSKQLEAEKLLLFGKGLFNPAPKNWHRYLKANSLLQETIVESSTLTHCKSWILGITKCLDDQFGYRGYQAHPIRIDPVDILHALPHSEMKTQWLWTATHQQEYSFSGFGSACLVLAEIVIGNNLALQVIDFAEASRQMRRVQAVYHSMYWLPPKSLREKDSSHTLKLLKALASIEE